MDQDIWFFRQIFQSRSNKNIYRSKGNQGLRNKETYDNNTTNKAYKKSKRNIANKQMEILDVKIAIILMKNSPDGLNNRH